MNAIDNFRAIIDSASATLEYIRTQLDRPDLTHLEQQELGKSLEEIHGKLLGLEKEFPEIFSEPDERGKGG